MIKRVYSTILILSCILCLSLGYILFSHADNSGEITTKNASKTKNVKKNHSQYKHGKCYSSEYKAWQDMKQRCNNKKAPNFCYYGGRGIKVCERWLKFENFYADLGDKPKRCYQLDRIDTDGHYEPSNCRWITAEENFINRRCSPKNKDIYITVKKSDLCKKCLAKVLKKNKKEKSGQLTLLEPQEKQNLST